MKLAYITVQMPFAFEEQFFAAELRSLAQLCDVVVIPTRPRVRNVCYPDLGGATPHYLGLLDGHVLRLAVRELRRNPRAVAAAARAVFAPRYALRSKLVNALAFPKALALAAEVRRLNVEHIHANWLTTPATTAYVASLLTGIPFSLTAHQHDIFYDNLLNEKVARATFVRVISERNLGFLRERLTPANAQRCVVGHLGVDVPGTPAEPPAPRAARILCASRLGIWKGHVYLLEALALLRDQGYTFTCDLAGDGARRDEVRATIARLQLGEHVRMLGNVPHAMLKGSLDSGDYDIFALASTERPGEHEGIPVAVMEAMSAGIPVVSTTTGSLPELVVPGAGLLVPQRDSRALAAALRSLLDNPALRRDTGLRGREQVLAEFESKASAQRLLSLIGGQPVRTHHGVSSTAC